MAGHLTRRSVLALCGSALSGGIAGCVSTGYDAPPLPAQPATEPRQFQYDARNACVTGTTPPKTGTLQWKVRRDELDSSGESIDGLASRGDHLVVVTREAIHALDPSDGSERWRTDPEYDGATPALAPALGADSVYLSWPRTHQRSLVALDLSDGSERWRAEPVFTQTSHPTLADDTIYIGVDELGPPGTGVIAVDATDGRVRWRFSTAEMPTTPAVANGTVYVGGGNEGIVYALDAETGEKRWEFATPEWMLLPPTVVDGTVYIPSSFARRLYALDATDGTEQWSVEMLVSGSVAATAESVYVPVMDEIRILSADGTERWSEAIGSQTLSVAPVVAGESLLVPGERAVCLNLTDGSVHWERQVEATMTDDGPLRGISCVPVVTDDGVFLGTPAGDVYAVGV